MFRFTINAADPKSQARTGIFETPNGKLKTPALAIVATEGIIRTLTPEDMKRIPLPYAIVNTFHILTKGILANINNSTVHNYGQFPGVVASDSGGFQVFSLGFGTAQSVGKHADTKTHNASSDTNNPLDITEEGVAFPWDDRTIVLNPERSMDIQRDIGADIIFAFDECTSPRNSREYTKKSVERTDRWLERCVRRHRQNEKEKTKTGRKSQALFGIVQGGAWKELRIHSAQLTARYDVAGFGIGGSFGGSFGDSKKNMHAVLEWIMPHLPPEKPRHLLGIGQVDDLFEGVERGVDLFDCVIPTREARHRVLYTNTGKKVVRKMKQYEEPIASDCECEGCAEKLTWRKLHELFILKDPRAYRFATLHNIMFFTSLMKKMRKAITNGTFSDLKTTYLRYYA